MLSTVVVIRERGYGLVLDLTTNIPKWVVVQLFHRQFSRLIMFYYEMAPYAIIAPNQVISNGDRQKAEDKLID